METNTFKKNNKTNQNILIAKSLSKGIPEKSHFSFQELCLLVDIKPYVLRFWETEFIQIKSIQSSSGKKLYCYEDVEIIFKIKTLLYDDQLSIDEAKMLLKEENDNLIETNAINSGEHLIDSIPDQIEIIKQKEPKEDKIKNFEAKTTLQESRERKNNSELNQLFELIVSNKQALKKIQSKLDFLKSKYN